MRTPLIAAAALAATSLVLGPAAGAQERESPRFGLGAGVDAAYDNEPGATPTYMAVASFTWQRRGSGLGLRSELLYHREQRRFATESGCDSTCPSSTHGDLFGATVTATYELRRASLLRPYVVSGIGVFVNRATASYDAACAGAPPGSPCTAVVLPERATSTDVGMGLVSGLGVSAPVGRLRVYSEARLQALTAPARSSLIPVIVGVRF